MTLKRKINPTLYVFLLAGVIVFNFALQFYFFWGWYNFLYMRSYLTDEKVFTWFIMFFWVLNFLQGRLKK